MASSGNLWDKTLLRLREVLDADGFNMWLRPTRLREQMDDRLVVEVPSEHFQEWIDSHYLPQIKDAARQASGVAVDIEFVVGGDAIADISESEEASAKVVADGVEAYETPLNTKYTFENFVVGESNRFAHAAAAAVADPNSRAYNPLFIYGGSGVGKTHLMHAIGNQIVRVSPNQRVLYATSEQFFNSFINSVHRARRSDQDPNAFRSLYRNVDLLMIDDIQFFIGKEGTQTEFFHTFNALYDQGKKIVISSDRPPMELSTLEERLKSRFLWGLNVDIQQPDLETRVAILRKKAAAEGIEISTDVILFIAERVQSNVRALEGALNRLRARAAMDKRQRVSMEIAKEVLVDLMVTRTGPNITVDEINQHVCEYFNIRLHELIGPARQKKYARARHIGMYLCRKLTDLSLPDLAARFGGRNHSTVLHACRKIERDLASDTNLQNIVQYIERAVRGAR